MRLKHFIPHEKGYIQYFLTEDKAATRAVQPLESASMLLMEFSVESAQISQTTFLHYYTAFQE